MTTDAARLRASLAHPVIDADGHLVEHVPALLGYVLDEGVAKADLHELVAAVVRPDIDTRAFSPDDMMRLRIPRSTWWALPSDALDLATVTAPRLYKRRLDEFGIDFSIVYPSFALGFVHVGPTDVRVAACRAYNRYVAEAFADVTDRIKPAAIVPMYEPNEAIAVLDHAVVELGLDAVMIGSFAKRPILDDDGVQPGPWASWFDLFGIDSAYDYDPFWRRCTELGVAVAAHSGSMGIGTRQSPTNFMFNHIGHFAATSEALAKSLVLGGVTARNPRLRVAFLEGGVHWARSLLGDLVGRWQKRNATAIGWYDPANTDRVRLAALIDDYASDLAGRSTDAVTMADVAPENWPATAVDELAPAAVTEEHDFVARFVDPFVFGCEADDPLTAGAWRTDENPLGVRLAAMFGSDIGHWDVRDPTEVLPEAYESVERGLLTLDDFREFVHDNVRRFYTSANPAFFKGTAVE
jgi:predicted TIM-barrel fold metal-dependent hydrolase